EYYRPEEDAIVSYGHIEAIDFRRPPGHLEMLGITTRLGLNCGGDTSLYLFQRAGGSYRLVLALESNDYTDVAGGQNWLEYEAPPADRNGNYFVVAADVNAWCSSRWQSLRYKVMRVGGGPETPVILLNTEHGVLLGDEPPFRLRVTDHGFALTFRHEQSL